MKLLALLLLFSLTLSDSTQDAFKISINVDYVVLNATVRDRKGRLVSDLKERDFSVQEDGVAQPLRIFRHEDLPITVGLVVDHSGSMKRKIDDVINSALTFLRFSNPQDQLFVVNFNEHVSFGLPPGREFTSVPAELRSAILQTPTTGKTALYDAIIIALERLKLGGRDRHVLIVISDGADNASKQTLDGLLSLAGQSNAMIYTIGIFAPDDPDRNPAVLRRIAHATGGEAFFPSELNKLPAICERIALEIRDQYILGYISTNQGPPGRHRRIRVVANSSSYDKLSVRTREGYISGKSQ